MNNSSMLLAAGLVGGVVLTTLGMSFESELCKGLGAFALLSVLLIFPTVSGRNL